MATGLTNLFNAVSADKARQAQINAQKIEDTVKLNALKKDMEQEERLNKYINVQGLLAAQGFHPDDAKSTIDQWRSMGWVDDGPGGLPRMQVRNAENAFKYLKESPQWKLNIAQSGYQRAANSINAIDENMAKEMEKDPVFGHLSDKYKELQKQKIALEQEVEKRGKQIAKAQLLFDPKLRETMEEKELARKEKAALQQEKLAWQAEQKEKDRQAKIDADARHAELAKTLKGMNQGRETPQYAGAKAAAAIEAKIKSAEKVLGRPLSEQEKRQMYLNDPYGIIPSGQSPQISTQTPKPLDRKTAEAIMKEAGGDKDKARELAKSRGYTF